MEKEVRSFRDKVGIAMMTLGLFLTLYGLGVSLVWLGMPSGILFPNKLVAVLVFVGIGLIRLSVSTVKK